MLMQSCICIWCKDTAATVPSIHGLHHRCETHHISGWSHRYSSLLMSPSVVTYSCLFVPVLPVLCLPVQLCAGRCRSAGWHQRGAAQRGPHTRLVQQEPGGNQGPTREHNQVSHTHTHTHTHSCFACGVAAAAVAWLSVEVCSTTACYALSCSHASFSYTQHTSCCCAPAGVRLTSTPIAF
jgi:hypothetical protein